MLHLPNIDETKDPIVKKLILAVQELADQAGTRDTVIFHAIHKEIKGVRSDINNLENSMNSRFESQNKILSDLENSMNSRFESQNQILSDLGNSVDSRFESQNQILSDMASTLKTIAKNTENKPKSGSKPKSGQKVRSLKSIAKNTEK